MDFNTGTRVTASNVDPYRNRYIAGRTHASSLNASKDAPAFQPAGPDQQLASTETSKIEVTASPVGRPSKPSTADSTMGTVKTCVTEDSDRTGLSPDDSGYGPSL